MTLTPIQFSALVGLLERLKLERTLQRSAGSLGSVYDERLPIAIDADALVPVIENLLHHATLDR